MLCALLIVFSLASAGLTMAWFTDEAPVRDTMLTAGTVDIEAGMMCSEDLDATGDPMLPIGVTDYFQGLKTDGSAIDDSARMDHEAVMEEDGVFFSLGTDGHVVAEFEEGLCEGMAIVVETTNDTTPEYPLEQAKVLVSEDGIDWVELGMVDNKEKDYVEFTGCDFVCAKYVKLVDATDASLFAPLLDGAPVGDGFDVDAIMLDGTLCAELNWNPGDKNIYELNICNEGTKKIVLRTKITGRWYEGEEKWISLQKSIENGAVKVELPECWEYCEADGFWYFTKVLAGTYDDENPLVPREELTCICTELEVTLTGEAGNNYQGKQLRLSTDIYAVQASNDAPNAEWGLDEADYDADSMVVIEGNCSCECDEENDI